VPPGCLLDGMFWNVSGHCAEAIRCDGDLLLAAHVSGDSGRGTASFPDRSHHTPPIHRCTLGGGPGCAINRFLPLSMLGPG
jgi:hypothetical protein